MNDSKPAAKLAPVAKDAVVKLAQDVPLAHGTTLASGQYLLIEEFVNSVTVRLRESVYPKELIHQGIPVTVLEPGKLWKQGSIRLRLSLAVEFVPEQSENLAAAVPASPPKAAPSANAAKAVANPKTTKQENGSFLDEIQSFEMELGGSKNSSQSHSAHP
ncbi:KGK domain-containing protein [Leptolyngbya sp. FACHB-261]|uniref:KGK domain-containing protein n=1 Tax=Leptolyngbya sp. FACHB-261 TaxID=2692806 RepID=UPI001681EEEE|nr:KGK domain-containing protein [Leptolyngbya sp. FACHB-261]MBD2100558.1 hypothetical protein [Leptolyngbya sp. FACHB-261]